MTIGGENTRVDARAKVDGSAIYAGDQLPTNALHAVVVFSNQPHARMLAIDTSVAEKAEGVVTIVTAADVPVNEYGLTMFDQPVFVGVTNDVASMVDSTISRWEADHVALVVADTEAHARAATALIDISWEQLPVVADLHTARTDEVLVHEEVSSNTYHELRIRKGDMAKGWADADVVVEGTYELPHQEHAYLQTESALSLIHI